MAVEVPTDAAAAVLNVTAVIPDGPGYVTVHPCDLDRPGTSNLNHISVPIVTNVVVVRPAADGRVCVYASRATDIVVDLFGTLAASAGFTASAERIVDTRNGTGIAGQLGID